MAAQAMMQVTIWTYTKNRPCHLQLESASCQGNKEHYTQHIKRPPTNKPAQCTAGLTYNPYMQTVHGDVAQTVHGGRADCTVYKVAMNSLQTVRSESCIVGRGQVTRSPHTARVCRRRPHRDPGGSSADGPVSSTLSTHGQSSP